METKKAVLTLIFLLIGTMGFSITLQANNTSNETLSEIEKEFKELLNRSHPVVLNDDYGNTVHCKKAFKKMKSKDVIFFIDESELKFIKDKEVPYIALMNCHTIQINDRTTRAFESFTSSDLNEFKNVKPLAPFRKSLFVSLIGTDQKNYLCRKIIKPRQRRTRSTLSSRAFNHGILISPVSYLNCFEVNYTDEAK